MVEKRPGPRNRPVVPPRKRPIAVWVITAAFVFFGLLFIVSGISVFTDAIEHGDEDAQLPSLFAILLGALTLLFTGGLFVGAKWGRTGTLASCVFAFVAALLGLMLEAVGTGAAMLTLAVSLCLFFALLGQKAYEWTGGK